jgi:hypothetical protein
MLSEGQMSDYKGAVLVLTRIRLQKYCWAIEAPMQIGSVKPSMSAASRPASRAAQIAKG